jgi:hypothetical protein
VSTDHLGIIELHAVCGRLASQHAELFETLGGWVATTTDPVVQQLFAEACHRHAWHADLWTQRRPAIPIEQTDDVAPPALHADAADRLHAYRAAIEAIESATTAIGRRVRPLLDPSTARVVELTLYDLSGLRLRTG